MKSTKVIIFKSGVEFLSSLLGVIEVIALEDPDVKRRLAVFWGKKNLEDIPMLCLHAVGVVCNTERYVKTLKWLRKQIEGKLSPDNPLQNTFDDIDTIIADLLSKDNIVELKSFLTLDALCNDD